jgi:hypothetical protein
MREPGRKGSARWVAGNGAFKGERGRYQNIIRVLKSTAQIKREGMKQDPGKKMTRGDEQKPERNQIDRALNEDKGYRIMTGACVWQRD